jgi:hypothetical protein
VYACIDNGEWKEESSQFFCLRVEVIPVDKHPVCELDVVVSGDQSFVVSNIMCSGLFEVVQQLAHSAGDGDDGDGFCGWPDIDCC